MIQLAAAGCAAAGDIEILRGIRISRRLYRADPAACVIGIDRAVPVRIGHGLRISEGIEIGIYRGPDERLGHGGAIPGDRVVGEAGYILDIGPWAVDAGQPAVSIISVRRGVGIRGRSCQKPCFGGREQIAIVGIIGVGDDPVLAGSTTLSTVSVSTLLNVG